MGGDHHDHRKVPYDIPDHKIYKIEGNPDLEAVQKYLAQKGLRDPWLRNEVWRYDPQFAGPSAKLSRAQRWAALMFKGFRLGLAATVIVISAEYLLQKPDHHGHGHGEHEHKPEHQESS